MWLSPEAEGPRDEVEAGPGRARSEPFLEAAGAEDEGSIDEDARPNEKVGRRRLSAVRRVAHGGAGCRRGGHDDLTRLVACGAGHQNRRGNRARVCDGEGARRGGARAHVRGESARPDSRVRVQCERTHIDRRHGPRLRAVERVPEDGSGRGGAQANRNGPGESSRGRIEHRCRRGSGEEVVAGGRGRARGPSQSPAHDGQSQAPIDQQTAPGRDDGVRGVGFAAGRRIVQRGSGGRGCHRDGLAARVAATARAQGGRGHGHRVRP